MILSVLLMGAPVALDPCGEGVVEWRAYQTILKADPPWPLAPDTAPSVTRGESTFDANTTMASAYAQARHRLDALALVAAGRAGCEVERLGCMSNAAQLISDLGSLKKDADGEPHWPESYARLRRKTIRRTMVNLVRCASRPPVATARSPPAPAAPGPQLWLIDGCEEMVDRQRAAAAPRSLEGPVVYDGMASRRTPRSPK